MSHQLQRIHDKLEQAGRMVRLIDDLIHVYQQQEPRRLPRQGHAAQVLVIAATDQSLRWPHRKILEFLLAQIDPKTNTYKPVQMSHLIKEAHVGKQAASSYLTELVTRGYLLRHSDGYRVFYKINHEFKNNIRGDKSENSSNREWLKDKSIQDPGNAWHARV